MSIIYNMTKLLPRARVANNRPISLLYQYTTRLPYRLCPYMYVLSVCVGGWGEAIGHRTVETETERATVITGAVN